MKNLIENIDFEKESDYLLGSALEVESYIKKILAVHSSLTCVLFHEGEISPFKKFHSYIFADKKGNLEVEVPTNDLNVAAVAQSRMLVGLLLDNVQVVFETKIEHMEKTSPTVMVLRLRYPKKMWRFQKRNSFRVKIPFESDVSITLDPQDPNLKNLQIVNLSVGGAALVINVEDKWFDENKLFENAILHLPTAASNYHITAEIKHRKKITLQDNPGLLLSKIKTGNWSQVGVEFHRLSVQTEQAIVYCVNKFSKK